MIEVTKSQYIILNKIAYLNFDKEYYNSQLARDIGVSSNLRSFIQTIYLMKDNNAISIIKKEGSNIFYKLNSDNFNELVANCDLFRIGHDGFILKRLGSKWGVWRYEKKFT